MLPAAITYGLQLAAQLPAMVKAGADIVEAFRTGAAKMEQFAAEKREPTAAEWDALNRSIDGKLEELNSGS